MIIYKFEHNDNCYIGSTKDFCMRCHAHNQHKKQAKHRNIRLYQYCNENEIEDLRPYMEILEVIQDNYDKELLRTREQDYMEQYNPNLNMIKACRR